MAHPVACAAFESGCDRQIGEHHRETDPVDPGKFANLDQRQDAPLAAAGEIPGQTGEDPRTDPFQDAPPGSQRQRVDQFPERRIADPVRGDGAAFEADLRRHQEIPVHERHHHAPQTDEGSQHQTADQRDEDFDLSKPHEREKVLEKAPDKGQQESPPSGPAPDQPVKRYHPYPRQDIPFHAGKHRRIQRARSGAEQDLQQGAEPSRPERQQPFLPETAVFRRNIHIFSFFC